MARPLTPGEVKALFRQLVKAAGGVEACAVELGCKHPRISLLQNPTAPDMPSFAQIMALEAVAGQDIVTGAASRAIKGEHDDVLTTSLVEAISATSEALTAAHAMDADGQRSEAEIRQAQALTQRMVKEAQQAADAAARMTPGRVH